MSTSNFYPHLNGIYAVKQGSIIELIGDIASTLGAHKSNPTARGSNEKSDYYYLGCLYDHSIDQGEYTIELYGKSGYYEGCQLILEVFFEGEELVEYPKYILNKLETYKRKLAKLTKPLGITATMTNGETLYYTK
jgi:hypothetical protein